MYSQIYYNLEECYVLEVYAIIAVGYVCILHIMIFHYIEAEKLLQNINPHIVIGHECKNSLKGASVHHMG